MTGSGIFVKDTVALYSVTELDLCPSGVFISVGQLLERIVLLAKPGQQHRFCDAVKDIKRGTLLISRDVQAMPGLYVWRLSQGVGEKPRVLPDSPCTRCMMSAV